MRSCTPIALAFVLVACDRAPPPALEAQADSGESAATKSPPVLRETFALPARYAAELPASSADVGAWRNDQGRFPPLAHVTDSLATGDATMFDRLGSTSERVSPHDLAAWSRAWHENMRYREANDGFCKRARPIMAAPPSRLRSAIAGTWAEHCASAEDHELVLRADTPDWALIGWYSEWRSPRPRHPMPFDARLGEALARAVAARNTDDARDAALALARYEEPAARAALAGALDGVTDPDMVTNVSRAMRTSRDAAVRAAGVRACQQYANRKDECDKEFPYAGWSGSDEGEGATAATRQVAKQLLDMGFVRVDVDENRVREAGDVAQDILVAAGHGYWFDVETGMFPNEHDSLLRRLAALTKPALDGVVFEEVAPAEDDAEGAYSLRAYVDGVRLETSAQNLGDWYDVDACLRLLDAALRERKASERYLPLATGDQTMVVVAGPPAALRAALEADLIEAGDPASAEAVGKDYERRVIEKLESGG